MRIKSLYIGDFGLYNNQHLENIAPGIVVIGGCNRSGKTTFLKLLRYLGYGFPRDGSLPPAAGVYEVNAVLSVKKREYRLNLKGYARPEVSNDCNQKDTEITVNELYNNLDLFTYKQIFTITLNELQRIPAGVSAKEKQRLQSVLLGAGLAEIIRLPALEETYCQQAQRIGGKLGRPNVMEFKPYHEMIIKAETKKKEALKQVASFITTAKRLQELQAAINKNEVTINELKRNKTCLDVLKNNYGNYQKLSRLETDINQHPARNFNQQKYLVEYHKKVAVLSEEYKSRVGDYQDKKNEFIGNIGETNMTKIRDKLIESCSLLTEFARQLAGYREKINNYRTQKKQQKENYAELLATAAEINSKWSSDLKQIEEINTDRIELAVLSEKIADYKELTQQLTENQQQIGALKDKKQQLKEKIAGQKKGNSWQIIINTIIGGVIVVKAGIIALFFNNFPGILLSFTALIANLVYYLAKYPPEKKREDNYQELLTELEDIREQLATVESVAEKVEEEFREKNRELKQYRELFNIEKKINPDLIKDIFTAVKSLKKEINKLHKNEEKIKNNQRQINEKLTEIRELLLAIRSLFAGQKFSIPDRKKLIARSELLFSGLEKMVTYLDYALDLREAQRLKDECLQKIVNFFIDRELPGEIKLTENEDKVELKLHKYIERAEKVAEYNELTQEYATLRQYLEQTLNSSDRIRKDFLAYRKKTEETGDLLAIFVVLYNKYTSREEVAEHHTELLTRLEKVNKKLETQKEEYRQLQEKKEKLASPDKLEKAHQDIDKARGELQPLAEEYAVNRSVAFILKKVRERLIGRTKKTLLQPASRILKEITGGEYKNIEPPADFKQPDFKTISLKGQKQESVRVLSRGTKEQLFLAVRLSRIQEIKPSLPVILDDSLVNFDCAHLKSVAAILARLTDSHQLFVLTCHPRLVDYIKKTKANAQFWRLEKGSFQLTDGQQLIEYLAE